MDRPAFMHAIMERATSGMESLIDNMNRQGLFDVYTNVCHCSYTYLDELPTPGCDPDRPQSKDVWAFGLAQLFSSVSPDITAEFEVPYMKPFIMAAVKSWMTGWTLLRRCPISIRCPAARGATGSILRQRCPNNTSCLTSRIQHWSALR